jgi:hypothetical protein
LEFIYISATKWSTNPIFEAGSVYENQILPAKKHEDKLLEVPNSYHAQNGG